MGEIFKSIFSQIIYLPRRFKLLMLFRFWNKTASKATFLYPSVYSSQGLKAKKVKIKAGVTIGPECCRSRQCRAVEGVKTLQRHRQTLEQKWRRSLLTRETAELVTEIIIIYLFIYLFIVLYLILSSSLSIIIIALFRAYCYSREPRTVRIWTIKFVFPVVTAECLARGKTAGRNGSFSEEILRQGQCPSCCILYKINTIWHSDTRSISSVVLIFY